MKLKPFQMSFLAAVENPAYDTIALSGPRGSSGKTFIAARLLTRCMTPGDSLFESGQRGTSLGAATLETGAVDLWLYKARR